MEINSDKWGVKIDVLLFQKYSLDDLLLSDYQYNYYLSKRMGIINKPHEYSLYVSFLGDIEIKRNKPYSPPLFQKSFIYQGKKVQFLFLYQKNDKGFLIDFISFPVYTDRLVATYFVSNPENKKNILHKDGNMLNCLSGNLEWVD